MSQNGQTHVKNLVHVIPQTSDSNKFSLKLENLLSEHN